MNEKMRFRSNGMESRRTGAKRVAQISFRVGLCISTLLRACIRISRGGALTLRYEFCTYFVINNNAVDTRNKSTPDYMGGLRLRLEFSLVRLKCPPRPAARPEATKQNKNKKTTKKKQTSLVNSRHRFARADVREARPMSLGGLPNDEGAGSLARADTAARKVGVAPATGTRRPQDCPRRAILVRVGLVVDHSSNPPY